MPDTFPSIVGSGLFTLKQPLTTDGNPPENQSFYTFPPKDLILLLIQL